MVKSIIAVIAAAAIAAIIVGLIPPPGPATAAVETGAPVLTASSSAAPNAAATQAAVTLPTVDGQTDKSGCMQAWPYYEPSCLRNSRRPNGDTRIVRVIADDRSVANRALRARH